ncbi:filamentous hemagglutinin N-terminal domain-containing protein [Dyella monticola]|nr:filamentous hemagglutinin N-terminal domain-containing protein [Dyella monticola]
MNHRSSIARHAARNKVLLRLKPMTALIMLATAGQAAAVTTGSTAVGQATITQNGTITTINQTSDRAIINWNNFDTRAGESVNFIQPSMTSATLNRVVSGAATQINGSLTANGQLYVVNPNGIAVGKSGSITATGVVLSGVDVSDAEFMMEKKRYITFNGNSAATAAVTNAGTIMAATGGVTFLGGRVVNEAGGVVNAYGGDVSLLAAGQGMQEPSTGDFVAMAAGPANALAANYGALTSSGGGVYLTAVPSTATDGYAISNTGTIDAYRAVIYSTAGSVWLAGQVKGHSNITLSSAGVLNGQGSTLSSDGYMTISANNSLALGQVDAGVLMVSSGGRLTLNNPLNVASDIDVSTSDALKANGAITSTYGNVTLRSGVQTTVDSVSARGAVVLQSNGGITVNGPLAGGSIDVGAATNAVLLGDVVAQGAVRLGSGNNLTVGQLGVGGSVSGKTVSLGANNAMNVWGGVNATERAYIRNYGDDGTVFINQGIHAPYYEVTNKGQTYTMCGCSLDYTPVYGADGYDQNGYNRSGFNSSGYNAAGLDRFGRPNPNTDVTPTPTDSRLGTGTIASGAGTITQNGVDTTIRQSSDRMIVNWDKFGISQGASVTIDQPSRRSAILNRVTGTDTTLIDGSLTANGQVFVINPYGVVVGGTGVINGNGVVLSALSIGEDDFNDANGRHDFALQNDTGLTSVTNNGTINGGEAGVQLLGLRAFNNSTGIITSNGGQIALVAANAAHVNTDATGGMSTTADAPRAVALVSNDGVLANSNGSISLQAMGGLGGNRMLVNTGTIEGGAVDIQGLGSGDVRVDGAIAADRVHVLGNYLQVNSRIAANDVVDITGGRTLSVNRDMIDTPQLYIDGKLWN